MSVEIAIFLVFAGCCTNLVFLELLMKEDPGGGNLVTFCQFFFISIEGLIFTSKFGTVPRKISVKTYMILVTMFFVTSVFNNYAFGLKIPMPLHMIFRAGSLIANMTMGIIILKKKYPPYKYLAVFMITFGIFICTLMSGQGISSAQSEDYDLQSTKYSDVFYWTIGIILLTTSLLISARMGIYQEYIYKHYGKHHKEALFYTHLLPIPFFLLLSTNLWEHAVVALNSPRIDIPFTSINLPRMIVYLMGNVLTQYMCISSVFVLTTECSSLTVTLILTLRKFTSLVFSIIYFNNEFSIWHWVGTFLVFAGTIIFTEVVPRVKNALLSKNKEKEA